MVICAGCGQDLEPYGAVGRKLFCRRCIGRAKGKRRAGRRR